MSRQKQKGTAFESAVVKYLQAVSNDEEGTIRREVLHGKTDEGDIKGLKVNGKPAILECKNYSNYAGHLSDWLEQALTEAGNADADYAFVVFKRRGCGLSTLESIGDQYVLTDLRTLAKIANLGILAPIERFRD